MMRAQIAKIFLPLLFAALVGACSDGGDERPDIISIDTPNAGRCEILDLLNCMFPWPSSAFTVPDETTDTGRRVNLNEASLPVNAQGVAVDPMEWNRNDGFSPSQVILAQVPGLDLERTGAPPITDLSQSLDIDSPVLVINAATGEPHLVFAELDANTDDPGEKTLLIRPQAQFERGGRYIVALRRLVDGQGNAIGAPEVFRALRDGTPTDNPAIEERRPAMEEMFDILEEAGVGRDDLYLAWEFNIASVRDITERILHIRDEAFADLGDAAPMFTVDKVTTLTECGDDGCQSEEDENQYMSRQIEGRFQVPNFLDSDAGGPGSGFFYDDPDDGLPDRIGGDNLFEADYVCQVARSVAEDFDAPPKMQARPSLYGHGLLGSRNEAKRGTGDNVNIMANTYQMMFCATDWVGFAGEDVEYAIEVLQDFGKAPAFYDRQQQGLLNFMFLARLLKRADGFAAHPAFQAGGIPVFDNSTVYYDGNSQGGILGGALMGVIQDVTRGVLGVPGMSYSLLLRRSIDFDLYGSILDGSYPSIKDQSFILSMAQMLWDRAEASGYAYHIQDNPLPNTPSHSVLLQVAFGDHQVSMWAAELMSRAIGARLRVPALEAGRHPDTNPFVAIEPVSAGVFTDSVLTYWDNGPIGGGAEGGGTAPPPVTNLPPSEETGFGEDPHSLPRKDPNAQRQKSEFLLPDGEGRFLDTCDPSLPCTTDGYVPGGGA